MSAWRISFVINITQSTSHHVPHCRRPYHPKVSSTAGSLSWQSFTFRLFGRNFVSTNRISSRTAHSKRMSCTTRISRIGLRSAQYHSFLRSPATFRSFASTSHNRLEVFAPPKNAPTIKVTSVFRPLLFAFILTLIF